MRVLIAGVDGYLGWSLATYLAERGHTIAGLDLLLRRQWVTEVGGHSAIPIASIDERLEAFSEIHDQPLHFYCGDMLDYGFLCSVLSEFQPEAVVHLAEMPSAAYSMIDAAHTAFTQQNNVIGTLNLLWALKMHCPDAHLVKLGTLGEYGTPNLDIPEGFFEVEYHGRKDTLPFPRQAGSFYHWSKVHDSNNIMFACKIWGLRSTDIMQGIVFGTRINDRPVDARMRTRLDFDQCFGTVINRFCCQAVIEHPLTIYGKGGQTRGVLPLRDSMQCLALILANPPAKGEYRVFNQFDRAYSISELAAFVQAAAQKVGLAVRTVYLDNPRFELQEHYYNPSNEQLRALGYCPSSQIEDELVQMLIDLKPHAVQIMGKKDVLLPDIQWSGQRQSVPLQNPS